MIHLHRYASRASRTTFNKSWPGPVAAPVFGPGAARTAASENCRSVHSQAAPVAPYKRLSPQRRRIPAVSTIQTIGADRASFVTQSKTPTLEPVVHDVFEPNTGTWQYIVADPLSRKAAIIDPVLDYDPATQRITTRAADSLLSLIKDEGLTIDWILETHVHADHLTASSYIQAHLAQIQGQKPPIGIGKRIVQVQNLFGQRYGISANEYSHVFDKLFDDDEAFSIGRVQASAIHLPGHTPDHLGYKIGDNVFCGDSIFNTDVGTARCDFPGGSALDLWSSTRKLLSLPGHVKIWTGHDYPPSSRGNPVPYMTVKDHKLENKHIRDSIAQDEFLALRMERDRQLGEPRLLHQSLQINIRAGRLPKPTEAGQRLLHLPLKLSGVKW
ncbi:probable metallo-beta-lactamase domain protein [Cephalotrichum gorgonifer]|uniref:Probable metallo-beta-lactamase domain protein n=1 Tax=Cephalotrichum gorgonifer TaxID=2041049 RepID=A0AAE8SSD1_9PEZI|nr:probable metallo-beta-lactamase domain protein [Cephalotrichum gorgonifer]